MSIWLRTRHISAVLFSAGAVALLLVTLGDLTMALPGFGALSGLRIPVALLAPTVAVEVLGWGLGGGDASIEASAARPIERLDLLLVAVVTIIAALACAAVQYLGLNHLGYAAARNAVGLSGMMLAGRPVSSRVGPVIPVAFLVVVAAFGGDGSGNPQWWSWPIESYSSLGSWAIALGLAMLGLGAAFRRPAGADLSPE